MSNPLHEIDKLFREGIESRSEHPPKTVWDDIDSDLERETAIKYKRKYNSLKRKAAVLLVLFIGLLIYTAIELTDRNDTASQPQERPAAGSHLQPDNAYRSTHKGDNSKTNIAFENISDPKNVQSPGVGREQVNSTWKSFTGIQPGDASINSLTALKNVNTTRPFNNIINPVVEGPAIVPAATVNTDEINDHSISVGSSIETGRPETNSTQDMARPLLSFNITDVVDSWNKMITADLRPIARNQPQLSPNYSIAYNERKEVGHGSRFSLAFQFSALNNWNIVKEDKDYDKWQRNRGGSGNGSSGGGSAGVTGGGTGVTGGSGGSGASGNVSGSGNWGGMNGSGNSWGGHDDDKNDLRKSEYNDVAYSGGVALGYAVSKKVSLLTGLNYRLNSSDIKNGKIYADKDKDGTVKYQLRSAVGFSYFKPPANTAPQVKDSITISNTRGSSSYLGLPVALEYRLLSFRKFSLSTSAGAQANFLLNGRTKTVLGQGTPAETRESSKTEGLKPVYFSIVTGITAEMRLNKNLSATIAPVGQFGVTDVNTKRSVNTRASYLGVNAGLKLRF